MRRDVRFPDQSVEQVARLLCRFEFGPWYLAIPSHCNESNPNNPHARGGFGQYAALLAYAIRSALDWLSKARPDPDGGFLETDNNSQAETGKIKTGRGQMASARLPLLPTQSLSKLPYSASTHKPSSPASCIALLSTRLPTGRTFAMKLR